jgi:vacuolar protein 8
MEEIEGLVRAFREGVDAAYTAAARAVGWLAHDNLADRVAIAEAGAGGIPPLVEVLRAGSAKAKEQAARALSRLAYNDACEVLIAEAGGIAPLVELLRDGSVEAKFWVARALGHLASNNAANKVLIAEAGGIPPLVELLRDGSTEARLWAPTLGVYGVSAAPAMALYQLALNNKANKVAIAEAGGIPLLVELWRDGSADAKFEAARALRTLARNNDANAVAIAVAVGLEALVELARDGDVTVGLRFRSRAPELVVRDAGIAAERKAALVVAALLRDCVPASARDRVPDVLTAVIGSYL